MLNSPNNIKIVSGILRKWKIFFLFIRKLNNANYNILKYFIWSYLLDPTNRKKKRRIPILPLNKQIDKMDPKLLLDSR